MFDPLLSSAAVIASFVLSVLGALVSIKLAKSERHNHLWIGVIISAFAACTFTVWQQYKASVVSNKEKADLNLQRVQAEKRQLELQLDLEKTGQLVEALDLKVNTLILSLPPTPHNPKDLLEIASAVKALAQEFHRAGGQVTEVSNPRRESQSIQPPAPAPAVTSRCDLNGDGKIDAKDVQIAINQSLGMAPCTTADGTGCDIGYVQRVMTAATGGGCRIGA